MSDQSIAALAQVIRGLCDSLAEILESKDVTIPGKLRAEAHVALENAYGWCHATRHGREVEEAECRSATS